MKKNALVTKTETLYRKYRPQSFGDILGQSEVVDTLKSAIGSGSIAHAYLFSGGRGTGKTSIARIFAHELGTSDQDIYEIDAASHTGVDNVRELRDGVSTRPFSSQYKIYIIDEAHMLSKQAFNALLKTLEEPPAHAIFILATTEKHKILDTILSRCQVFDFKLAGREHLVALIQDVAQKEGRIIDLPSAEHVARMGDGSFRDTLSHLQKVFASCGTDINFEQVQQIYGTEEKDVVLNILKALSRKDKESLFEEYDKLTHKHYDFTGFLDALIENVSAVIMMRYSVSYRKQMQELLTESQLDSLSDLPGITSHTLRSLLEIKELVLKSSQPEESFEVFLFEQVEKWQA